MALTMMLERKYLTVHTRLDYTSCLQGSVSSQTLVAIKPTANVVDV